MSSPVAAPSFLESPPIPMGRTMSRAVPRLPLERIRSVLLDPADEPPLHRRGPPSPSPSLGPCPRPNSDGSYDGPTEDSVLRWYEYEDTGGGTPSPAPPGCITGSWRKVNRAAYPSSFTDEDGCRLRLASPPDCELPPPADALEIPVETPRPEISFWLPSTDPIPPRTDANIPVVESTSTPAPLPAEEPTPAVDYSYGSRAWCEYWHRMGR